MPETNDDRSTNNSFPVTDNPENPNDASQAGAQQSTRPPGAFAAPGWQSVRDGLVLVYMGYVGCMVAYAAMLLLVRASMFAALTGAALLLLAMLAVLVGKWMCRGVPSDSGLRHAITVACCAFTFQFLCGLTTGALHHWVHFGPSLLAAVHFSTDVAALIGTSYFLSFLSGVAQRAADRALVDKAQWILGSFVVAYSLVILLRLSTLGSTGHLAHHAHVAHHLRPMGGMVMLVIGLPLLGALIAWLVSYLSLIKSLADKIDADS